MKNFTVYFTKQIDSESKAIEVFMNDELFAHGSLNLCSNMAHVQILEKHRRPHESNEYVSSYDLECAIEDRAIEHHRILVK
tara:strand:+ start:963 stop:1205 length:243 start_codon:yes stop_codon:yes gene_type:complete